MVSIIIFFVVLFIAWCTMYNLPRDTILIKSPQYNLEMDPDKCKNLKGDALADLKVIMILGIHIFFSISQMVDFAE